jgi:hypothetical protein
MKKHLYIKGHENKFQNIFNVDKFNNLLENSYIEKFLLALNGEILHADQINRDNIRRYLLDGYTIKLNFIEYLDKDLLNSTNILRKELLSDVKINLYASAPSKNAFYAHLDNYDIFILHIHGKKQWFIADISNNDKNINKNKIVKNTYKWDKWNAEKSYMHSENFFKENKSLFKSYILEKGDLLYIPKGFVHKVHPIEETLHLTLGFRTITGIDFFLYLSLIISKTLENKNIPLFNKYYSISLDEDIRNILNIIKKNIEILDSKKLLDSMYQNWLIETINSKVLNLPYNYFPFEKNFQNRKLKLNTELFKLSEYNNKIELFIFSQSVLLNSYFRDIIEYISNKDSFTLADVLYRFKNVNEKLLLDLFFYLIKNSMVIYYD